MSVDTEVLAMPADEFRRLSDIDSSELMHSWAVQSEHEPQLAVRAAGNYVWDQEGRRYLDFTAQQWHANVGHGNRRVLDAVVDAASGLATMTSFATVPRLELAHKLLELLPPSYSRVFFGCNGSDANEAAIKTARLVTRRQGVISFWNAYHGGSMAATSATGLPYLRVGFGEPVPGTLFVPAPYHYRSPIAGATQAETDCATVEYLRRTIEQAGPETIAALIGEPFNATAGMVPGPDFWRQARDVCDEYGILLIGDEVVSGFGRTGRWFARDYYDYEPDIITFAKGLTSGYLPLSAAVFRRNVVEQFEDRLWPHGLTYSGHSLCCVAGLANIAVIEEDGLVEHAASMGRVLAAGLEGLKERHPSVGDVRSIGLYGAVELVADRQTKQPFPAGVRIEPGTGVPPGVALEIAGILRRNGILVNAMRVEGIVKFSPPLTIECDEVEFVIAALDDVLGKLDRLVAGR
jgi:taurine--2-oxoglutarate transaminase